MSTLLNDLHNFSMLKHDQTKFVSVDLNECVTIILQDFEVVIESKKATINISALPVVQAEPAQMNQLFYHLVGNALKFSKENPVVDIGSRRVTEEDYSGLPELKEGTGIGLAICKKIIENHKGCITATGKANEGATFTVFLPAA